MKKCAFSKIQRKTSYTSCADLEGVGAPPPFPFRKFKMYQIHTVRLSNLCLGPPWQTELFLGPPWKIFWIRASTCTLFSRTLIQFMFIYFYIYHWYVYTTKSQFVFKISIDKKNYLIGILSVIKKTKKSLALHANGTV